MSNMKRFMEEIQEQANEAFEEYVREGDTPLLEMNPHDEQSPMARDYWTKCASEILAEYDAWIDQQAAEHDARKMLEAA